MNTKKGSILAYSLVVISIMLAIASSLSAVSIIEKKSANSTEASMQALQTADSGLQLAIKKLNSAAPNDRIDTIFNPIPCSSGSITTTASGDPSGASYTLSFINNVGNTVNCNARKDSFVTIKSVGTYKNTFRTASIGVVMPSFSWKASATCGISVYGSDIAGSGERWGPDPLCGAPQCNASNSLVADNLVDFSAYDARNACKTIGGRLPTPTELSCMSGEIQADNAIFVSSFKSGVGQEYWSSLDVSNVAPDRARSTTVLPTAIVPSPDLRKNSRRNVRCVR